MINNKNIKKTSKEKIVEAAIKVFGNKGFNGATTKEIAEEAGVAEGTIFRYFKSKKDLLINIATPLVVESLTSLLNEVSGSSDEEIIKAIIYNRLKIIQEHENMIKILAYEAMFHPEVRDTLLENIITKVKGIAEEFIGGRIKEGRFKNVDPSHATRCLVGMVMVMVVWRNMNFEPEKEIPLEKQIDQLVDIFLHGINQENQ